MALSLTSKINLVERAWSSKYPYSEKPRPYITDVYDSYVIVAITDGRLAKVAWSFGDEDRVDFAPRDEWEIVEHSYATVKAVEGPDGEWILEVLGIPYGGPRGGKDLDGEYFTPESDLWLERIPKRPIIYYHGLDDSKKANSVIGEEVGWERRGDGVWFRVVLDKTKAYAKRVWEAAQKGLARASSGAISHLVRKAPDGRIIEWPIGELSLLDDTKTPINEYAVALPAAKAVYGQVGIDWPDEWNDGNADAEAQGDRRAPQSPDAAEREAVKAKRLLQLKARALLIDIGDN